MKRYLKLPQYVLLCLAFVSASFVALVPSGTSAVTGSDWNAARIIDDAVFYNPNAMTSGEVQSFLNAKVPICDTNGTQTRYDDDYGDTVTRATYSQRRGVSTPFVCLKDYTQAVPSKPADNYCPGSISAGQKTAAGIIKEVAAACSINPKVLIVTLQKEQSLITDDWPWPVQYQKAMGYGCPDTAPCDEQYYGFFNQVYNAAHQFQRYAKLPDSFNYAANRTSYVLYQANNPGCGGSNVAIQNQGTAGLYNYTPYQPNAAALSNLYGSGDACSAYGNRNFWRLFNDWFGSTKTNTPFEWAYVSQQYFSDSARAIPFTSTATVAPGAVLYVRVRARNMGNQVWLQNVRVGASRPNDRLSPFYDGSTWLSPARPAQLLEASVNPGSIGTFEFTLKAPSTTGSYSEYFNILVENAVWLNDPGMFFTVNVVEPRLPSGTAKSSLGIEEVLTPGNFLLSPDTQSVLILQPDGNLVLYRNTQAVWHSNTAGRSVSRLRMQSDGNLVLYATADDTQPIWWSSTQGHTGVQLNLQTDGNMVLQDDDDDVLWESDTVHIPDLLGYVNDVLRTGNLYPGQQLELADRRLRLVLQTDGNLVLYSSDRATWSSGTWGKTVSLLRMQSDGNLVLYDTNGGPLWHTGTWGKGLSHLIVQSDGNLVLYDSRGLATWNSNTAGVF